MKLCLTILLFLLSIICRSQTTYYFDATLGDDARTAAQAQNSATPWKTLSKLSSFWNSLNAGDVVRLKRGETFFGSIIATKGGTSANNIKVATYGAGNKPIITGFTDVTAWTNTGVVVTGGSIWQSTNAISTLTYTNVVTVNSVATAMGRTPNAGSYLTIASHTGHSQAVISSLTGTPNYTNAQLVARTTGNSYIFSVNRIISQNTTQLNTVPAYTNPFGFTVYDYANGNAFLQNALATLDLANEWYYDPSSKKISIVSSGTPTAVKVATVDSLVRISAGFITFDSLDFRGANTDCFQLLSASTITIRNCDIRYCGDMGVQQQDNSPNISVLNCTLRDIYNSGITNIGYGGNTNNQIIGNTLVNINMIPGAWGSLDGTNLGIAMYNPTSGDSIRNNSIDSTGYSAIFEVGQNFKVRNNFINHFCYWNTDGGGIYTGRNGSGRFIIGNIVINGMTAQAMGIYGDENTSGVTVQDNSVANCVLGIYLHNGHDCTIRGNTVFQSTSASMNMTHDSGQDLVRNNTIRKNIFVMTNSTTTQANVSYQDQPESTPITDFGVSDSNNISRPVGTDGNAWFTVKAGPLFVHYTLAQWQAASNYDLHSTASPLQVTLANTRFVYNASSTVSVQSLGANYLQILAPPNTTTQWNGSITLQPWTSAVLLLNGTGPPPLSGTATVTNPTCFGGTGSITINATGGASPYQYRVGSGSFGSSNVFSALAAGTYTFQIRDAASTVFSINASVIAPPQISISQSSGTILVNGGTTTTTVTASGGTGTLQYKLDAGSFQSSNVFTGVAAGTHTITVRDANLCTNTLTYTLTQPSVLNFTASALVNPLVCNGNTTSITGVASGGTAPYTYNINGGSFQSSATFSNLGAGTYTLTVRDAASQTKTATVTITQPTAITISESHTAILVNGGVSTATITASGGTGTLVYSINGTTFQSSNVFTNLTAGSYTVTVRDANLCTKTLTFTITQPTALTVNAAVTTVIACNGGTGVITVSAANGTPPYQYRQGTTNPFQSSPTFSVTAGTYQFFVLDAGGALASTTITITQPTAISMSVAFTSAPTTVTITASGGTAPRTFSLDGSTFQSSNTFTNVGAGNHTAVTKDANGCQVSQVFNVGGVLGVSLTVGTITCNGGSTTATVSGTNGTTPYSYSWSNGGSGTTQTLTAGTWSVRVTDAVNHIKDTTFVITQPSAISMSLVFGSAPTTVTVNASGGVGILNYSLDNGAFQAFNTFANVAAGNHTMRTRDANGCTVTQNFNVGSGLGVNLVVGTITCNGGTATATASGTGGTAPYTFLWSNNSTAASQVLLAGTWSVRVTDAASHIKDTTFVITQPSAIAMSLTYGTAPTTVTVTASGGTAPLRYSLDGGTFQLSNTFAGVAAGNHTITTRDNNLCTISQQFNVLSNPVGLTLSVGTISCNGGTATATVQGTGGTPPYNYLWIQNNQTPPTQQLTAGTWTVRVTDAVNQQHDTTFVITQPAPITFTVATGTIAVNGGTTTVTVNSVSGGTSPYQYSLDGGAYQGSNSFAGVTAGNHTVSVKDANSCIQSQNFTISQPGVLIIGISRGAAITCAGGTQAITVSGSGGTTPYTFAVDGGTFSATALYNSLAGSHTYSVKDNFGARADTIITITEPDQIAISVTTGTIIVNGGNTTVTATATGGTGGLQYSLDGGAYQGTGNFSGVLAGSHTVTVKDANNCTNVNTFSISEPGELLISVSITTNPLLCYGDQTAYTFSGSGGTAPLILNRAASGNLSAGTYLFRVTDAFGATHDSIITISQPSLIALVQITQFPNPILSYGGNTDSLIVQTSGGTPINDSVYEYKLDGGAFTQSDSAFKYNFGNVSGGQHTVTIRDDNGCTATYTFTVNQPPPPAQYRVRSKRIRHIYYQLPP